MSIQFNPGCPCCVNMTLNTGVYCRRWRCVNPDDMPPGYESSSGYVIIYFPPQKVTLWHLGYGLGENFVPNEVKLSEISINDEVTFESPMPFGRFIDSIPPPPNPSPPPLPVKIDYGSNNSWYRLVFDLGEYGILERHFYIANTGSNYYYTLSTKDFPKLVEPQDIKLNASAEDSLGTYFDMYKVIGIQELNYVCMPPCIVDVRKYIEIKIKFDSSINYEISYDYCACSGEMVYNWPYPQLWCNGDMVPIGHGEFKRSVTSDEFTVKCKWNGSGWISDPINIGYWSQSEEIYDEDGFDFPSYEEKADIELSVSIGSLPQIQGLNFMAVCDPMNRSLGYSVRGSTTFKNHTGELDRLAFQTYMGWAFGTSICNRSGDSFDYGTYGDFFRYITNFTCNPVYGDIEDNASDKAAVSIVNNG